MLDTGHQCSTSGWVGTIAHMLHHLLRVSLSLSLDMLPQGLEVLGGLCVHVILVGVQYTVRQWNLVEGRANSRLFAELMKVLLCHL